MKNTNASDVMLCVAYFEKDNCIGEGGGGDHSINGPPFDEDHDEDVIVKHQTKMIHVLHVVVCLLLVSLAALVCVGVFLYTKREEEYNCAEQYEAASDIIIESFYEAVERKLQAVESMSAAITSYALSNNKTFNFVTLPNFAVLGSATRVQADASILHWMPLVREDERLEWEEYALEKRDRIDEGFVQDKELRGYKMLNMGIEG